MCFAQAVKYAILNENRDLRKDIPVSMEDGIRSL